MPAHSDLNDYREVSRPSLLGVRMNPQQPQPLASTSQLISSPSTTDGVPKSLENDLRVAGCMMIQEAGIMLNLSV